MWVSSVTRRNDSGLVMNVAMRNITALSEIPEDYTSGTYAHFYKNFYDDFNGCVEYCNQTIAKEECIDGITNAISIL